MTERTMQIILREDVDNLGKKGDTVDVARGYARNFLLPKKLAMEVNENNLRMIEKEKKAHLAKLHKEKEEAEQLAELVRSVELTFRRKVHGEELYGSVSSSDIVEALEKKGYEVEKRKVQLDDPIKNLGEFDVSAKLHPEVTATFKVKVEKEEE
jgi:large subunit ribosomal protein L9